jgi:hypothetical protein
MAEPFYRRIGAKTMDRRGAPGYDMPSFATPRGPPVPDYDALRDYLLKQTVPEFILSLEQIEEIIDDTLPRASHRASWWETARGPLEKMPQREACIAGGYNAVRLPDNKGVRFTRPNARIWRK